MKKGVRLVALSAAIVTMVLLCRCSTKNQDHEKDEGEDLELTAEIKSPIVAFENVDAKVKNQINGFLAEYFAINQMLILDKQDSAKVAARKLSETVRKFDKANLTGEQMDFYLTQVSKLNQGLEGIMASADIEKTRAELATVSEGMYALVKAYHPNESPLYYQFCPMAKNGEGANWLSSTKEVINPYMGQMMPACGRTEETIQ